MDGVGGVARPVGGPVTCPKPLLHRAGSGLRGGDALGERRQFDLEVTDLRRVGITVDADEQVLDLVVPAVPALDGGEGGLGGAALHVETTLADARRAGQEEST